MDEEELRLHHRPWLEEVLRPLGEGLSEYCFANLYLYRHVHDYRLLRGEQCYVSGRTYDGCRHLLPLFDPAAVDPLELVTALAGYDFYYPLSRVAAERMDARVFVAEYLEDDSDYVYDADHLRSYRGRKLHKKRNQMQQFLRLGGVETHPLTGERIGDAREVLKQWQDEVGRPEAETDYGPCAEALEHRDILGLCGIITYTRGVPAGFLLSKEIRPGECVLHFAKGKRGFPGVFPFLFNEAANQYGDRFRRFNFEQDLGRPNFRRAKRSYAPIEMLRKYRMWRR